MCTLIVMKDVFEEYPLVVASNRDEHPQRPSAAPKFWTDDPKIFAPRDLVLGGTWIGVNRYGVFAALTNLDGTPHKKGLGSRGRLLANALRHPSARSAKDWLDGHLDDRDIGFFSPPPRYNGFNLVLADGDDCYLVVYTEVCAGICTLGSGVHIITGYGHGPTHAPRARGIMRRWRSIGSPEPGELDALLNFHGDGTPEAAACVHDPREFHKTILSMIVRADREWSKFETWSREGPACGKPFGECITIDIQRGRS